MNEQQLKRQARLVLFGERRFIRIGRSSNSAAVNYRTPVEMVEGNQPPSLHGSPYLKTSFHNGDFHKILYTPSTFRIVVGKEWVNQPNERRRI